MTDARLAAKDQWASVKGPIVDQKVVAYLDTRLELSRAMMTEPSATINAAAELVDDDGGELGRRGHDGMYCMGCAGSCASVSVRSGSGGGVAGGVPGHLVCD